MKIAYIAHPIGGDVTANLVRINAIVRKINREEPNVVPFVPYYADIMAMDDNVPAERERGIKNDHEHFRRKTFDVLRLYGDRISMGMNGEIIMAKKFGIPVVPMTEETSNEYYKP
jgi:hypothetical protein